MFLHIKLSTHRQVYYYNGSSLDCKAFDCAQKWNHELVTFAATKQKLMRKKKIKKKNKQTNSSNKAIYEKLLPHAPIGNFYC